MVIINQDGADYNNKAINLYKLPTIRSSSCFQNKTVLQVGFQKDTFC